MRSFGHQGRTDANHAEIVRALRRCGCSVLSLASVGNGCPDLLVGLGGRNVLLEVKTGKRELDGEQVAFHAAWNGPIRTVRTAEEAIAALGLGARAGACPHDNRRSGTALTGILGPRDRRVRPTTARTPLR